MKIMIAYPALNGPGIPMLTQNRQFQWQQAGSYIFPVIAASAATLLKENGFSVIWYDGIAEKKDLEDFFITIKKETPDLIAIETKTPVIKQHWQIIKQIKNILPNCFVSLMGDHPAALPQESFEQSPVDIVINHGHFDFALLEIAQNLKILKNTKRIWNTPLKPNLNTLPFIDRTLTKANLYGEKWKKHTPFMYIMAGRDCCYSRCTFCSWTNLFKSFRVRSVSNVLDEIGWLIENYGTKEISDDTGSFPEGKWLIEFCLGMIARGYNKKIIISVSMRFDQLQNYKTLLLMKQAGFRKIKCGLESANPITLKKIKKNITLSMVEKACRNAFRANIEIHLTVITGFPWENINHLKKTYTFVYKLMTHGYIYMLQSTLLMPYPGTKLYKECIEKKYFKINPQNYELFAMQEPILKTKLLNDNLAKDFCLKLYKLHFHPFFIYHKIKKIKGIDDLVYMIKGFFFMNGHLFDFSRIKFFLFIKH